ncbi:MAG: hypothetical protein U1E76_14235 [Planctomycetota bacterium]
MANATAFVQHPQALVAGAWRDLPVGGAHFLATPGRTLQVRYGFDLARAAHEVDVVATAAERVLGGPADSRRPCAPETDSSRLAIDMALSASYGKLLLHSDL